MYTDNIIATLVAMADWFSPSDIEALTLENGRDHVKDNHARRG